MWGSIRWVFSASSEASLLPFAAGEAPSKTLVETAKEAKEKAKETALAATEKAKDLASKAATKKQQQQQQFV